ncbi:hypothetical protein FKM82_029028 [Ascaphus truei]
MATGCSSSCTVSSPGSRNLMWDQVRRDLVLHLRRLTRGRSLPVISLIIPNTSKQLYTAPPFADWNIHCTLSPCTTLISSSNLTRGFRRI